MQSSPKSQTLLNFCAIKESTNNTKIILFIEICHSDARMSTSGQLSANHFLCVAFGLYDIMLEI